MVLKESFSFFMGTIGNHQETGCNVLTDISLLIRTACPVLFIFSSKANTHADVLLAVHQWSLLICLLLSSCHLPAALTVLRKPITPTALWVGLSCPLCVVS